MWYKANFFKYGIGTIIVLVIILLLGKVSFFLEPFKRLVAILFFPLLISLLFYYLMRPLVRLGQKIKLPSTLAIALVFLVFIGALYFMGSYTGTLLTKQFYQLKRDFPGIMEAAQLKADALLNNESISMFFTGKVEEQLTAYVQKFIPLVSNGLWGTLSKVTEFVSVLVVVPFIVFYLLKDDKLFISKVLTLIPQTYNKESTDILKETDKTLSTYIIGQAIIALIMGVMMYIAYLIIGLKYAIILAMFMGLMMFIPILGFIVGLIPAFLVGLSQNPWMGVKALIVAVIIHELERNFIAPYLIGKRLAIHPLTIILIFLGAASLYGFVGILIAVPTYAVLKVVLSGAWKIYCLYKYRYQKNSLTES